MKIRGRGRFGGECERKNCIMSNNCYVGLLGDKTVKFKDLGELAKEAIDLDPSHLEDIVTGMFVTTIHKA